MYWRKFGYRCVLIVAAAFVAFVLGCAARQRMTEPAASAKKTAGIVEDWDPASLGESEPVIPAPEPSTRTDRLQSGQPEAPVGDSGVQPSAVLGYRVQIASTPFEEVAREVRKEALLKFEEPVYVIFDAPYYKVRVGDCVSRFEAEELQQKAIEKGFGQAWVVRTLVSTSGPEVQRQFE